jgi:lysine N6-hydroxylase
LLAEKNRVFHAVGVGVGPFNLSTAALLDPLKELDTRFFEREREFQWHPGLMFPEATIQVSFLKDLVTLADPTSRHSFLAFLSAHRRLYRFINANFARVSRLEFNQYFRWVANRLPNVQFGQEVRAISFDGRSFLVRTNDQHVRARNIILGGGLQPTIPECAVKWMNFSSKNTLLHAGWYLYLEPRTRGIKVAVVGGGQTGADIVQHLLLHQDRIPQSLVWISRRSNFLPLDESPFTNELFTPNYSDYFYGLSTHDRLSILAEQKMASDGVSGGVLERIYQLLYEAEFLNGSGRCCSLFPGCELVEMKPTDRRGWQLTLKDRTGSQTSLVEADVVVFATGSHYQPLTALDPILDRLHRESDGFVIRDDYSIEWNGPPSLKIYLQNGARHCRGIADPNLSLMAWRSAKIINSLAGTCVYDVANNNSVFDWSCTEEAKRNQENDRKSDEYVSQDEHRDSREFRLRNVGT